MSSTLAEETICRRRLLPEPTDHLVLSQQLNSAKEMGFSDGDLLSALELREKREEGMGNGGKLLPSLSTPFKPFPSTNAMLDTLKEVQSKNDRDAGRCRFPSNWRSSVVASLEERGDNTPRTPPTSSSSTSSSSINRSQSFNAQEPQQWCAPQGSRSTRSSLQRLIATFEAENHRHFDEYRRLNRALRVELASRRESERELKRRLEEKSAEVGRLTAESNRVEELFRENSRLRVELIEKDELIEQLSLALSDSHSELTSLRARMGETTDETAHRRGTNDSTTHPHQTLYTGPTCTVCMDRGREVIFMPCLHYSCCKPCAESLDHCGICRLRIMGKIEFFQ